MKRMHGKVKVLPIHKPRVEGDVEQKQEQKYTGLRECPVCSSDDVFRYLLVVGGKPGALEYSTWCQCLMCGHAGIARVIVCFQAQDTTLDVYEKAEKSWNTDPARFGS